MSGVHLTSAHIGRYAIELRIEAPRARVWRALADEIDAWWLPGFRMLGSGSRVTFEARAGGLLLETGVTGATLLWYTVHASEPEAKLALLGHLWPEWGGPTTSTLTLSLADHDAATLLTITDAVFGKVEEPLIVSLRDGWTELFRDGLKAHCEAPRAST